MQEQIRDAQLHKEAARTVDNLLANVVKVASRGVNALQFNVSVELANAVEAEVQCRGLRHALTMRAVACNLWCLTLQKRLNVLCEKLGGDSRARAYVSRLAFENIPSSREGIHDLRDRVESLVYEMARDEGFFLPEDARLYMQLNVKPLLAKVDDKANVVIYHVSWEARDALNFVITRLEDVPSWLLSTSGSGLMGRIAQCMEFDAEGGLEKSLFEVIELPLNPERWGQNSMSKFVHAGQPIGVSPFSLNVFSVFMNILGFKAVVDDSEGARKLTLSWSE